jgi:hypothetical protein
LWIFGQDGLKSRELGRFARLHNGVGSAIRKIISLPNQNQNKKPHPSLTLKHGFLTKKSKEN